MTIDVVTRLMEREVTRLRHASRGARLCVRCRQRRPRFRYRGVVKADRHHTLCFQCFRALANRMRALEARCR